MTRRRPIWILCPQYRKRVRGWYEAGERGVFRLGPDGSYLLDYVRCTQDGGRCMQTLCVLHRFNRRGPESWYPERILTIPARKTAPGEHPAGEGTEGPA